MSSQGNDIQNFSNGFPEGLFLCDQDANCTAFTSFHMGGQLKSSIDNWDGWGVVKCEGTYVKVCPHEVPSGYRFHKQDDSPGGNIGLRLGNLTIPELASRCDAIPGCQAFTHQGWLKGILQDLREDFFQPEPCAGLYVKECTEEYPGYTFYPAMNSQGGDFISMVGESLADLISRCDQEEHCLAVDHSGYLKNRVERHLSYSSINPMPCGGLWVKVWHSHVPSGYVFWPYQDSEASSIQQVASGSVPEYAAACTAESTCKAFNTQGSLKSNVDVELPWLPTSSNVRPGIYLKECPYALPLGYTFWPQRDSPGSNINCGFGGNITALADMCTKDSSCVGFNTDCLKSNVSRLDKVFTPIDCQGLYVKSCEYEVPDGYTFFPRMDSLDNNIMGISGTIDDYAAACSGDPACAAFSSEGYTKGPLSQLQRLTGPGPCSGIYVKTDRPQYDFNADTTEFTHDPYFRRMRSKGRQFERRTGVSLSECQARCRSWGVCNSVDYAADIGECLLQDTTCSQPFHTCIDHWDSHEAEDPRFTNLQSDSRFTTYFKFCTTMPTTTTTTMTITTTTTNTDSTSTATTTTTTNTLSTSTETTSTETTTTVSTTTNTLSTTTKTNTKYEPPSSYGDPHTKNARGQHFDIARPGNHTFLVVPRGMIRQAKLSVVAHVTPRGNVCKGVLFITGLTLGGGWLRQLGGDIDLYAATDKFNSPDVVGLRVGGSGNMSLQEFASRIPKGKLSIHRSHPGLPSKPNSHVNTLTLRFHVGPSVLHVGWAHERLRDGAANWLWLKASHLGVQADNIGGLLGADDHSEAAQRPKECQRAGSAVRLSATSEGATDPIAFRSWASVIA